MMWWPHFLRISATILHPAPGPQNLNFGCQGHPQTPSFEVRSSLTQQCCCTPPQWENTTFYPLLHRNHPTYTNHCVKAHPLPKGCHFSMSFSFQSVQCLDSRSLPSLLILTPIPGEASHPKNTIQARAEIPESAARGATAVLCSNTSGKMKLRTVYGR